MFNSDFRISGKHANYWKDLCELAGNVPDRDQHSNFKIFNAYIDAYIVCPLIGYQFSRKGVIDTSVEGNAGMLAEVLIKRSQELKYVYQILMLVDEDSEPDVDNEKQMCSIVAAMSQMENGVPADCESVKKGWELASR